MIRIFAALALLLLPAIAHAQTKQVVTTCGAGVTLGVGDSSAGTVNTAGQDCVSGLGGTGSILVTPGLLTIVALDVATVTTGGTAVTALAAGHRNKGGFLLNPKAATIDLCINEQTAASGTVSAGGLVCVSPGQSYTLSPSALGVSVVTSDSAHPFAGQGLN